MNAPSEKIVDKIEKLLRKAHGTDNAEEAQAFAQKAQELALRYKLELSDIEWDKEAPELQEIGQDYWRPEEHGIKYKARRVQWAEMLARIVARHCQCAFLVNPGSNSLTIVGAPQDRKVFSYLYGYLVREGDRLGLRANGRFRAECARNGENWKAENYRASWLSGFVVGVAKQFEEMREQMEKEFKTGTALVRLTNQLQKAKAFSDSISGGKASRLGGQAQGNEHGARHGFQTGRSIPLNQGIGDGSTKLIR